MISLSSERECFHQEVLIAHPELDGAKGMLNCLSSNAHRFREMIQAPLHLIENSFVFPTAYAPLVAWRALILHWAILAP